MVNLDPAWFDDMVARGGAVLVVPPGVATLMAVRQFATDQAVALGSMLGRPVTYPLRIPHHSISAAGLATEIPSARDGALVLDELQEFSEQAIDVLALSPSWRRKEFSVFAMAKADPNDPTQAARALEVAGDVAFKLGVPLFVWDGAALVETHVQGVADTPRAPGIQADLDQINAHRRRLYMAPLDPAVAGWSDDDIRLEAARLRAAGNPARAELLSWSS